MSAAQHALETDLRSGRFLAGVCRGRWQLLAQDFPVVIVAIVARNAQRIVLRFDCTGYPEPPPTATMWDMETQQRMAAHRWPRGSRVSRVFNPGWKGGAALYIPCDRQSIEGHANWYAEYPWLIWKPTSGLVHYVEAIHEVLQSHDLVTEAA